MTVVEHPRFVDAVRAHETARSADWTARQEALLPGLQAEYETNKAVIERLGLPTEFESARDFLIQEMDMHAEVTFTYKPGMNREDPKFPYVDNDGRYVITFRWAARRESPVNEIFVQAYKGKLLVASISRGQGEIERRDETFAIEGLDVDKLHEALGQAYRHPGYPPLIA